MANTALQHPAPTLTGSRRLLGRLLSNKVWLPKALYELLPAIYLITGVAGILLNPVVGPAAGLSLLLIAAGLRLIAVRLRFRYLND